MTDEENNKTNLLQKLDKNVEIKSYFRRWIILAIFIFYSAINSYEWIEYSIITNIVARYYNVTPVTVAWTSIIYMALYAPLVIPASYILDKKGLRWAALIGAIGTVLGTGIKVFSIQPDRFWVVLLGQGILSASQLLILCLPPRIAAVWFKANEVSTACSLGVFGTQLGCAIGFVLSPILVKNHDDMQEVAAELKLLCWILTACAVVGAMAVVFYFPLEPPKPPNFAQVEERNKTEKFSTKVFFGSIKQLMGNKPFVIHMVAYGINIGVFSAVGTFLNQFILEYFPNSAEDAGRMGLVMIIIGMIGSVIFGIILDKTHKYKETTMFTYVMSVVSIIAFMFALELRSKLWVYVSIGAVGLFTNAYMPVGFELAMELTYPSPEGTTTGLLVAPSQIMGVIFSIVAGEANVIFGTFWSLAIQALLLSVGVVFTFFVPNKLKRQEALQNRSAEHVKLANMVN